MALFATVLLLIDRGSSTAAEFALVVASVRELSPLTWFPRWVGAQAGGN
ncbi:hypothetical protein ACIQ6Y_31935 [Streptomyces sp. NPDC096205]